jgi:hypothetical protein
MRRGFAERPVIGPPDGCRAAATRSPRLDLAVGVASHPADRSVRESIAPTWAR